MNIKYARILNTYCPTGDAVNPVCGRFPSTCKSRTWHALSSPDGQSPLPALAGKARSGVCPPGGAAGGAAGRSPRARSPPAAPPLPGPYPPGTEPLRAAWPRPRTRTPRPFCLAPRVCGRAPQWGTRGRRRRGATREAAPLGARPLSQRVIRGIGSCGSTKPLTIKLLTSPGILSWAFYHRGYSLGLNHQCLSLVLLSILTTWFPSTANKHQRLCRNPLRLPRCCTQLTWLQI